MANEKCMKQAPPTDCRGWLSLSFRVGREGHWGRQGRRPRRELSKPTFFHSFASFPARTARRKSNKKGEVGGERYSTHGTRSSPPPQVYFFNLATKKRNYFSRLPIFQSSWPFPSHTSSRKENGEWFLYSVRLVYKLCCQGPSLIL